MKNTHTTLDVVHELHEEIFTPEKVQEGVQVAQLQMVDQDLARRNSSRMRRVTL